MGVSGRKQRHESCNKNSSSYPGLLALANAQVDPNSEVEIVGPPVDRNPYPGDDGPGFGVSVVRIPFPLLIRALLGNTNRDSSLPSIGSEFPFSSEDRETTQESSEDSGSNGCGLPCFLFGIVESQLKSIQEQIDDVRDRQNEVDFTPGSKDDFDINNSTYTSKVLEDGSVVHINRTTIADSNDDGTSFFLHKTIF